jgi:surface protein
MISMFSQLSYLTTLDISSFDFTKVTDFDNIFEETTNLENLTLKNYISSNTLDDYLPDRTSLSTGKITLKGDGSGLDSAILLAKNWEAYDSVGNGIVVHSGGSN